MKISCEKATELCTRSQYGEASWWQTLKLKLHLFYCKTCSKFSAKNSKFTSLCEHANMQVISENEKEAMKERLKKQL